jgi:hypothetical protein
LTAETRPADVSIRATGDDATTDEPWSTRCRTSAAGNAPEPPTGVAQPNLIRPDVIADGSAPVPGRRGSWMVANPSQINRSRTTGCSNRACTTSHAERARRSSYCLVASSSSGGSPELSRACAAPRPPSQSRIIARSSSESARENRATSSTVASRSRCTVTASPDGSGNTTAGSVKTYFSPYVDSRPSSSSRISGLDWMSTCALEHESCRNPGRVSSSVTVLPPTRSCASSTHTSSPAWAR